MSSLGFSPGLGRTIRQDPPRHLGDPTRPLLEAAVLAGRVTEAVQWLDYFLRELANIRDIFGVWDWSAPRHVCRGSPADS